jgi:general secretion pathway protein K
MRPPASRSERGFALLIALWTLVLIALIVTYTVSAGREQTRLASNLRTEAELSAAADGAVQEAIFHVLDKSETHWPADGIPRRIVAGAGWIDVRITSEAGKVNLNTASPELLTALLIETGTPPGLARSIAANITTWRSPAGQTVDLSQAYRAAGRDYAPPNAPFETLEEMGDVLGITPAVLQRASPYLTIYHDGDPDSAIAAAPVLRALEDLNGKLPTGIRAAPDESVVEVTAVALRGRARQYRRAIVRLSPGQGGQLYEILDWRESK